ncbi:MAG: iron-sulfur cluster assembly protein, partial [Rhodospirillales bacterium]
MTAAKAPSEAEILAALKKIPDPDRRQDIVALGMVQGLIVKDGHVAFSLEVDAKRGGAMEPLRKAAEKAVEALPGVLSVSAVLTAQKQTAAAAPARQAGTG